MKNLKSMRINSKDGLLCFENPEQFQKAYARISRLMAKSNLAIDEIEEFQREIKFSSLRQCVLKWEENDNEVNNDRLENTIPDPVLQQLLSKKSKVKIGDKIYDFNMKKIAKNAKKGKANNCKIYLFGSGTKYYSSSNSKRVKLKGYIIYVPFLMSIMGAKVKSQKRKNNGSWKKYRTKLQVAIVGDERNKRCDRPTTIRKSKGPKKRKTLSVSLIKWGGNGMWFKPMEASAKCVYGNSGTYGVYLT